MTGKRLGWILFGIMTVIVIVLSAVLIANNAKWKSGEELLSVNKDDVESVTVIHNITSTETPQTKEANLSQDEIQYLLEEFQATRFEKSNEKSDSGASQVVLKMKDGSEKSFSVCGSIFSIDGKTYKAHSYLSKYLSQYGI